MEFLKFIFSSFWIWLGFVILIVVAGEAVTEIIKTAIHRPQQKKVTLHRVGNDMRYEVENAGLPDIVEAVKVANGPTEEATE